jgi:hypothetical protein
MTTYFDIQPGLAIIDMLSSVGVVRQTCAGGAPTLNGGVRSEHRRNIARNGQAFDLDAGDSAALAIAFAKLRRAA